MANKVSSIKRMRTTERRTIVNKMRKSKMRGAIRAMRRALESKDAKVAATQLSETFSVVDRAAKQGVIKKNAAARYKSRLSKRVKALSGQA